MGGGSRVAHGTVQTPPDGSLDLWISVMSVELDHPNIGGDTLRVLLDIEGLRTSGCQLVSVSETFSFGGARQLTLRRRLSIP